MLLNGVHARTDAERQAIVDRVAEVRAAFAASVEHALHRWFTPGFAAARPAVVDDVRQRLHANDVRSYGDAYEVFATADSYSVVVRTDHDADVWCATGGEDQRSTPAMAEALAALLRTASQ